MFTTTITTERIIHQVIVCASMCVFFLFGFYHLAEFETTDEHLWKYERIPQYWQALATHDWAQTYINDKPGVTVALISGIGLFFEPHPEMQFPENYVRDPLLEKYDPQKTLRTNFIFRLPVLICATCAIYLFYVLISAAYGTRTALLSTVLIATNPILLGISQIINPDSFFWIFGGLAICAYIAHMQTKRMTFLILCGTLTGFAFLSKYTAFTLLLFYVLYEIGYILFEKTHQEITINAFLQLTKKMLIITCVACGTFLFFLPAAIFDPSLIFRGIGQFLTVKKIVFGIILLFSGGLCTYFGKNYINRSLQFIYRNNRPILIIFSTIFLGIFMFNILNVWTGQKMIPFDDLRDAVYANEPQSFNFKPFLIEDPKILRKTKAFFLEFYPIMFSMTPVIMISLIGGILWSLQKKAPQHIRSFTFTVTIFFLMYFSLTVVARVVVNVRYSIILYPIITLWAAIIITELCAHAAITKKQFYAYTIFLLMIGILALWHIRPFYFSYTNMFLPREFSIHDSWGHGSYEAAQYLNALPHADKMIIWSNSDTVCRFFVGSCLRKRKIDLSVITPDYFVISKRGVVKDRNHFILENNSRSEKDAEYYFTNLYDLAIWILQINDRPDNYLLIIPYEKN